jgi:hypothetical protein
MAMYVHCALNLFHQTVTVKVRSILSQSDEEVL